MYICKFCGATREELPTCEGGDIGEIGVDDCSCGGYFVEAETCKWCENHFDPDDLTDGYCKDCIKDIKEKYGAVENIIAYAKSKNLMEYIKDILWDFVEDEIQDYVEWVEKEIL